RLQTAFDPKKLAVGGRSFIAHQAEHEVSRFLWIVAAGLFHPAYPVPIALRFRSHPFGFGPNRCPHLSFHVAWVKNIRGHAGAFQLGGEVSCELIKGHFARRVRAVERTGWMQRGGRGEVDDPAPVVLNHSADKSATSKIGAE